MGGVEGGVGISKLFHNLPGKILHGHRGSGRVATGATRLRSIPVPEELNIQEIVCCSPSESEGGAGSEHSSGGGDVQTLKIAGRRS